MSDDYGLIIQRMLGTDALGIGPSFIFEEEIRAGRLAVVSSTFDATYVCWMITTPERWNAPLLKGMAELAKLAVVQPPRAAAG